MAGYELLQETIPGEEAKSVTISITLENTSVTKAVIIEMHTIQK